MKKLKKSIASLFIATAMFAMLTACGKQSEVSADMGSANMAESNVSESDVSESDVSESVSDKSEQIIYPITIKDSNGKNVIIEKEPERVVSVAPNLTEIMFELGAGDKLVGRSDYCDYPEKVLSIESVGSLYEPDIEKIISLSPDIVIVSTFFDEANMMKLEDAGITVLTLCEEQDMQSVYTMINTLGQAVNRSDEAISIIDDMKATISDVESRVASLEKPSVYYVVDFGQYGDFTATGDTYIAGLLEKAGCDNIAQNATGWSISFEKIVEGDPDYIIISPELKEDFINADNYKELRAVKEGNVYTIDNNMLDRQGVRNDDAIAELAKILHPEAF